MIRYIFGLMLLPSILLVHPVRAQDAALRVESAIDEVTVFLNGAQVTRSGRVSLPSGRSTVQFLKLDPDLDPESIQFSATGGPLILSVSHKRNFLEPALTTAQVEEIIRQIKVKEDSIALEEGLFNVYEREESMLMANQSVGGTEAGVDLQKLAAMADFFRERLTQIHVEKLARRERVEQLVEEKEALERQRTTLMSAFRNRYVSEVEVLVEAETAGEAEFQFSYVTRNARWSPLYDVRVSDIAEPMMLFYKAELGQSTGEDWSDTGLTLSTADPSRRATKPTLRPQRARFLASMPPPQVSGRTMTLDEAGVVGRAEVADAPAAPEEAPARNRLTVETRSNTTSIEFDIPVPYSIPSGEAPSLVDIAQHELEVEYEYYTAPRLIEEVFLTARGTDWERLNLLNGPANLFFANTFVGRTMLDMNNVSDTLYISLGSDQGIVVERTAVQEFTRKQFLGNRRVDEFAFEIEVRNTKSVPISILIEDQIPVSANNDIEVRLVEDDGAAFDDETGFLRWDKTVPPAQTERVEFRYTLRYPRDRSVIMNE